MAAQGGKTDRWTQKYKYFLQAMLGDAFLCGITSRNSLGSGKLRGLFRMGLTALSDIKKHKAQVGGCSAVLSAGTGRGNV